MARSWQFVVAVVVVVALALLSQADAARKKDPKECEVCKKVLGAILEDTPKDIDAIDDAIDSYCKTKRMNSKDKKMCYYIKSIKRKVSQPAAMGIPVDRLCKKLNKQNGEICEMRYPVKVDKDTDYAKLRVKALKTILRERGVKCEGCLEKSDFIKRAKETEHLEL